MTCALTCGPFTSSGHHLSYDDCLEDKGQDYQNCSLLCCARQLCTVFAFVVLGLVSSVLSQRIGWEERLRNDLLVFSNFNETANIVEKATSSPSKVV